MNFLNRFSRFRTIGLVILVCFTLGFITKTADDYFEISKNMEIFGDLYVEVNKTYVDETDPTQLMRTGVDAMLGQLDPYTNYYSESQIEYARVINSGQYSGIGAEVGLRGKNITFTELFGEGPADEAGVKVGDVLQKIDELSVVDKELTLDEVNELLLGEKDSYVKLTLDRPGVPQPMVIAVKRGGTTNQQEDVPYFGMINDSIGYVLLAGFSGAAAAEMLDAVSSLKRDNPEMSGLVLDLRSNPGGRLDQAVDICNLFIPKGEVIVEMRGRTPESQNIFKTRRDPWDTDIPVAVVVNSRSASASEIVSGALQDLDRGVIVGQRSFGKGLVQNVRPLTDNPRTQMKITIAKYYTPSGRCIQAIDYANRNADGSVGRIAEDLITAFETRNGRVVYDGGGIDPDIAVDKPAPAPVVSALESQNLIFAFANAFANKTDSIPSAREFTVDEQIWKDFLAYTETQSFDFQTNTEESLKKLEELVAKSESASPEVEARITSLQDALTREKDQDLLRFRTEIEDRLRREIVQRFYFKQGLIEAGFEHDPEIQEAVSVLQNETRYQKILQYSDQD